jgi:hypothetical protein
MRNHKRATVIIHVLLLLALCTSAHAVEQAAAIALVPKPLEIQRDAGVFRLKADTAIVVDANSPEAMDRATHTLSS